MDRLRHEFKIIEMPDEMKGNLDEALSLWEMLEAGRESSPNSEVGTMAGASFKGMLSSLVKKVQGEDPKRWAHRIERRISDGDESVTFLQKQAAKGALH